MSMAHHLRAADEPVARRGFRSRRDPVGGVAMHALVSTGPVAAMRPPVVLVHGLALSGRYMMPTAQWLARRFRVWVPDLPGFGDSGHPRRILRVNALADSLAAWMAAVGLERADMLGNSFGCQIIAAIGTRHPNRLRRAVLQGPTTPPDERGWYRQWRRWRQNSPNNPPEMDRIARSDYRKCGLVRALTTFHYGLVDRIEDRLPWLRAPVLVVRGARDPICRESWAEEAARLARGRLVLIPGAAHTLVYTAPRELGRVAQQFFDDDIKEGN